MPDPDIARTFIAFLLAFLAIVEVLMRLVDARESARLDRARRDAGGRRSA